jgi:FtsZ-interacting cell division protein ZipA
MNNNLLVIFVIIFIFFVSFKKEDNTNNIRNTEIIKLKNKLTLLNNAIDSLSHIKPTKNDEEEKPVSYVVFKGEENNKLSNKIEELSKSIEKLVACNCPKEEKKEVQVVKSQVKNHKKQIHNPIKMNKERKEVSKIIIINKIINKQQESLSKKFQDKILIDDLKIKRPIDLLK